MSVGDFFQGITAATVVVAAWQIYFARQLARTRFEDDLNREYREIASVLPLKALLGEPLEGAEYEEALPAFYRYFDLSNQQIFLRQRGRISKETWEEWRGGIDSHMRRPAFRKAWKEIKRRSRADFGEMRMLESNDFEGDPHKLAASWMNDSDREAA